MLGEAFLPKAAVDVPPVVVPGKLAGKILLGPFW